jgi:isoamyl acetate esterase
MHVMWRLVMQMRPMRQNIPTEKKQEEEHEDMISIAWLFREAISHILQPSWDMDGFPLFHTDFSNCNVLFDKEFNLTGVIDWTHSHTAPWEQFCPRVLEMIAPSLGVE